MAEDIVGRGRTTLYDIVKGTIPKISIQTICMPFHTYGLITPLSETSLGIVDPQNCEDKLLSFILSSLIWKFSLAIVAIVQCKIHRCYCYLLAFLPPSFNCFVVYLCQLEVKTDIVMLHHHSCRNVLVSSSSCRPCSTT